ncbi:MAG: SufD family Fe-S cluster assembly protein [Lachnospiraceae bacterium]|nr:SufD family Fe-S cluster assembly protein [Lachnospiraceae bacterium]
MEENKMIINRLPMKTWNRLNVNHKNVTLSNIVNEGPSAMTFSGAFSTCDAVDAFDGIETGMGPDFDGFVAKNAPVAPVIYEIAENTTDNHVEIVLDYDTMPALADGSYMNVYRFIVGAGSELNILLDIRGTKPVTAITDVKIIGRAHSNVKLVEAKRLSDDIRYFGNVGTDFGEKANFELVHVTFSGKEVNEGCTTKLSGDKSSARYDIGYLSGMESDIDQSYLIRFTGKNTNGEIYSNGVLRGTTRKNFRGTIDFIRGCVGASGSEKEDVLLMDDTVVNLTSPLILCGEEDVEGEHGATLGRLAEEILFYLEARGVSEGDAYKMVADGRMASVIRHIPESPLRSELLSLVSEDETIAES